MIIACDFDGTIVTHEYPKIGKPIPFAIQTLKKLQEEDHHQIILWTVREGDLLQEALDYCKSKGLEFYAVNSNYPEEEPEHGTARKLVADLWIDDRNLGGLPYQSCVRTRAAGQYGRPETEEEKRILCTIV